MPRYRLPRDFESPVLWDAQGVELAARSRIHLKPGTYWLVMGDELGTVLMRIEATSEGVREIKVREFTNDLVLAHEIEEYRAIVPDSVLTRLAAVCGVGLPLSPSTLQ